MTIRMLSAFAAVVSAGVLCAQDEAPSAASDAADPAALAKPAASKTFTTLPLCRLVEGGAEVLKPGETAWALAEEGRFYPLGSAFRTGGADSRLTIAFGPESSVSICGDAAFRTKALALGSASRTVEVVRGTVRLDLARNLPEGAFVVQTPGFLVRNPAGEATVSVLGKGDGEEAVVRCVTGTLGVEGRHFEIPQMRAANEVRIRSSQDHLFTALYGTSGNYVVRLDGGVAAKSVIGDDGSVSTDAAKEFLEWHLTPETRVEILRAKPALGERMSVCVTTWDAAGEKQNERVFSEGRAEVNSGELVKKVKSSADELAKKAAEATEETTAAVEETAATDDASKNENNNEEE